MSAVTLRTAPTEPVRADPPRSASRPVLHQRWADLAYFHWPYEPGVVQRLLPEGVEIDTFDGAAWVALVPFVMRDVRVGPSPVMPYLGTFVEINVRTYVVDPLGRRAVWFFSLDVPRSPIVAVARTVFALPYRWSRTGFDAVGARRRYTMHRRGIGRRRPSATIEFTIGDRLDRVSDLDHFLTARWALLTRRRSHLRYAPVHHERWPLHRVDAFQVDGDVVEAAGLPSPVGEPRALCSPGVDVAVGWLEHVGRDLRTAWSAGS